MKFTFTCKKVSLNDSIRAYAEKKASKLDRYFRDEAEATVTFSVEKDHRCVCEITIRGGGTLFRAQTESADGDMRGPSTRPAPPSTGRSARTRHAFPSACGRMP